MKYLKLYENFDEYNYDNAKNNPDRIVVKFAPGGFDKFWNQYIKSTGPSYSRSTGNNWHYFRSWGDLEQKFSAKGLEMESGVYYLLFKNYDPKDLSDWRSKGGHNTDTYPPATFYFLKYNKEAGEIGIYDVYGTEYQDIQANEEYHSNQLKGNIRNNYCRIEKDGKARVADVGSIDHRGYFEIISIS